MQHTDADTTIGTLKAAVERFVSDRKWQVFHTPKNVAMALIVEAAELPNVFKWHSGKQSLKALRVRRLRTAVGDELADVVIYCLTFANCTGIDISTEVLRKIKKNERKYPVRRYIGRTTVRRYPRR